MKIILKDGSFKEYENSKSVIEIAADISEGLATPVDLMEALQQSLSEMKPKGRRSRICTEELRTGSYDAGRGNDASRGLLRTRFGSRDSSH